MWTALSNTLIIIEEWNFCHCVQKQEEGNHAILTKLTQKNGHSRAHTEEEVAAIKAINIDRDLPYLPPVLYSAVLLQVTYYGYICGPK